MNTINDNVGVRHGCWGENEAEKYLKRHGYRILDRNTKPVTDDKRLEIDIVAYDRPSDSLVFVEVKQHATISKYARRLRSITAQKKRNLRRACYHWRLRNKWCGYFRFDVIEVYGTPENGEPYIDHMKSIDLFAKQGRFVRWN